MKTNHDALAIFILSVVIDARRSKIAPEQTRLMSCLSSACGQDTVTGTGIFHVMGCTSCGQHLLRTLKIVDDLVRYWDVPKKEIFDTTLEVTKAIHNGAGNREINAKSVQEWFLPTQQALIGHITTCHDCARVYTADRCSPQRSAEYVDSREEGMSLWPSKG